MKLEEYTNALNKMIKDNPEAKNYELIYSSDSEGNSFHPVEWLPTTGFYSEDGDFIPEDHFDEWQEDYDASLEINSICLN
jgi:hypothetical protein